MNGLEELVTSEPYHRDPAGAVLVVPYVSISSTAIHSSTGSWCLQAPLVIAVPLCPLKRRRHNPCRRQRMAIGLPLVGETDRPRRTAVGTLAIVATKVILEKVLRAQQRTKQTAGTGGI